jgi:hypothetical protein
MLVPPYQTTLEEGHNLNMHYPREKCTHLDRQEKQSKIGNLAVIQTKNFQNTGLSHYCYKNMVNDFLHIVICYLEYPSEENK